MPDKRMSEDEVAAELRDGTTIGDGSTLSYCRVIGSGPTVFTVQAVDTSGNRSAPSNELVFDC